MQEILGYIGKIGDVFGNLIGFVISLFTTLGDAIIDGLQFIVAVPNSLYTILTDSIFLNLPTVFRYGLTSILGCFIVILALKIFSLIKFW